MTPKWFYALTLVAFALIGACMGCAPAAKRQAQVSQLSTSPRAITSLDSDWMFHPMPGFKLWAAEPQLTTQQIGQLHCPWPGQDWHQAHLPDDYVVRGNITQQPNPALLVDGAQCLPGEEECQPPTSASTLASAKRKHRPHERNAYGGHGYLPVYPAWYRRTISIPASARGKSVWLNFGGVYRDAVVFVNGKFIAQHPSGYTGFRLNITSAVHYARDNSVSVFVDPRWFEGWWYEGGGIYRHVRLIITDKLQVAPWGTFVISKVPGPIHYGSPAGDQAAADLTIQTTVRNDHATSRQFVLLSQVIDPAGKIVASTSSDETLAAGQERTFDQRVTLQDAHLWSLHHCNLYHLATTLRVSNSPVDRKLTTFGIRTLRFDPDHGFFLDGKHVEIRGTCNHQGFPGVGIGVPNNLWAWRIAKLKAMGSNAYRTAHNPAGQAFYRTCDRMGMLVMAENRHLGDTYYPFAKKGTPYSKLSDIKAMVLQLRNHPSIIMWSLCNLERLQGTREGAKIFAAMRTAVRKIDPTRPTTNAMGGGYTKYGFISVEDILGMSYHDSEFAKMHAEFPKLMIFGSEDYNSRTSRGTLQTDPEAGICSEYGCGATPEIVPHPSGAPWWSWAPIMENPFVAGNFIWTGFDYRGEPNPFSWPAVTSQVGSMDLCGFPKSPYYFWKAWWKPKTPSVYVFPDWDLPKSMLGKSVVVRAYSNCQRIELLLNGKSLGQQTMPRYKYVDWHVPYAPGQLTALGYDNGRVVARYTTQTAGSPKALQLSDEVHRLAANGEAVAPIRVEVVDAKGRVVPLADNLIRFSVSGAGTLAGVANGNPVSHESNVANHRKAFHGLCMVLVRAGSHPGAITVVAQSEGLTPARIVIHTF